MSTRWLVTALVLLTSPLSSFGVDTIPCIVINGKAYAPAVLLGGGTDLPHTRTMAGHEFVWVREYADATGGELAWDGGLRLYRDGAEVAALSTQPADRYWRSSELLLACPDVWGAAGDQIAPHVGTRPVCTTSSRPVSASASSSGATRSVPPPTSPPSVAGDSFKERADRLVAQARLLAAQIDGLYAEQKQQVYGDSATYYSYFARIRPLQAQYDAILVELRRLLDAEKRRQGGW